jgi:purine-binding chemotaxis protein CheW
MGSDLRPSDEAARRFQEAVASLGRDAQFPGTGLTEKAPAAAQRRVLTFDLGAEEYGLDILRIREISRIRAVTPVPRAAPFLLGVLSLRGTVLPVMDLRMRMRMPAAPMGPSSRILVVHREDELFGLVVDRVRQVVRLTDDEIEPPPPGLPSSEAELLAGIGRPAGGRRLVILVELDAILTFQAGGSR